MITLKNIFSKYVEKLKKSFEDAGCKFKTSDGVWWNLTDVTHPVVALKEGELDNLDSKTTFKLLAHFGPNGELRVSDIQWELANNENPTQEEKEELKKLYAFISGKKYMTSIEKFNDSIALAEKKPCSDSTRNNEGKYYSCYFIDDDPPGEPIRLYDSNGNTIKYGKECNSDYTKCDNNSLYVEQNDGTIVELIFNYYSVEPSYIHCRKYPNFGASNNDGIEMPCPNSLLKLIE